jgi:hypothetical protein
MKNVNISSVRDELFREARVGFGAQLLDFLLSRGAKVHLFAGAVRDSIAKNECGWSGIETRDWDIGISQLSRREFSGVLREAGGLRNRYGGYKLLEAGSCPWEFWRLEDTVGLRQTESPFSLENVLRSFVLSCNALAFDFDKGWISDHGALRSIYCRELRILDDAILHHPGTFSAKAISLNIKLSFNLHRDSWGFVYRHLQKRDLLHESRKTYSDLRIFG